MYLLYAYARIRAVFRRAEQDGVKMPTLSNSFAELSNSNLKETGKEKRFSDSERALAVRLLQCPEVFSSPLLFRRVTNCFSFSFSFSLSLLDLPRLRQ